MENLIFIRVITTAEGEVLLAINDISSIEHKKGDAEIVMKTGNVFQVKKFNLISEKLQDLTILEEGTE